MTRPYLRDLYERTIQVIDTTESFRDMVSALLDICLTMAGNRMNEVMRLLTIIATIFIPIPIPITITITITIPITITITFVAGVYGVNFKYMPKLEWRWGYFGALGVMAAMAVSMVLFFRRKRWL